MMNLKNALFYITLLILASSVQAKEIKVIETADADIDVRIFPADGDVLLLGFACDEGKSIAEEKTAISLAEDGIEVWMPDMLTGMMLPKVKSSISSIPTNSLISIVDAATKTGKKVYLISSGSDTELVLRSASEWEALDEKSDDKSGDKEDDESSKKSPKKSPLAGAILMFPRLFKEEPVPGKVPEYVDSVGKTRLPIMLLEGERTPNRWGLNTLSNELQKSGSNVTSKVIPDVRGYFFKRQDASSSEDVVTSQMAGLIKVSLFYIEEEKRIQEEKKHD